MSSYIYLSAVLAALLLSACTLPVRKPAALPSRTSPEEAAPKLSEEDSNKVQSLYYKAVGAYSNNDMGAALEYLKEISALSPYYPPAAELREKIRRVSGGARPATQR
ncbi:MAG TPA: hypothetical protein DEQ38_00450 [Elusimicrobia bacterium]|nr:MAG: hypothetical protein A2089_05140 [Elusimicrobia bacterium GWD2_63_28]HCC46583.1 hypothetical protein [Elusimicrobiota bacterium]